MNSRLMHIDYSKIPNLDQMVEMSFATGQITPLMATIVNTAVNNPAHVRRVLDNHTDFSFLNRPDPITEITPLMQLAVAELKIPHAPELVAILLEPKYGVNIHARSGPHRTQAIFGAAELGSNRIVKMLLDHGADVMSSCPGRPTKPINVAIAMNHHEVMAHLVNAAKKSGQLKDMLNTTNKSQQTAAQVAMIRRRAEIVGIMARAGGDLRNSFYAFWDCNPNNQERFVYVEPDPQGHPEAASLYQTVYSFVSKTCCYCREPVSDEKKTCCSQCTMAWYCGAECQRSDWKTHKKCCKKLKRGVDLVLGSNNKKSKRKVVPYPLVEQTGFEEDFIASKNQLEDPENDDFDYDYAWEYHGIDENDPTKRVWKKYPPLINVNIESCNRFQQVQQGPRYSYRPNQDGLSGRLQKAPFPLRAPSNVATRFVSFPMMMEFDIYTGATRAVRRVGAKAPPPPKMPKEMYDLMAKFKRNNQV